jgi:hypothetical protein
VNEHFVKATSARPAVRLVAEVPFAKYAGGITSRFQHLGQNYRVWGEPITFVDRVRHAIFEFMATRQ